MVAAPARPLVSEASSSGKPRLLLQPSPEFRHWLDEQDASLCLTAHQAGKIFLIGRGEETKARLSVYERSLERCTGLAASAGTLQVVTHWQLWRFEDALSGEAGDGSHDAIFVPQSASVTGDLHIHDIAIDGAGQTVFVNTLFSCLAAPSESHSFRPIWKPSFISHLAPDDRCHLNGLALRDGSPAFVTAAAQTNEARGWHDHVRDGGCVIDVESNEVVADGLSLPRSPRWYDGKLWLHNAGSGEFGTIDLASGRFEPMCFCPGYLRGLSFHNGFAVLGVSKARGENAFKGLRLADQLQRSSAGGQCAVMIVDLAAGKVVHWLKFVGVVEELYDIAVLPGLTRPMMVGLRGDEIRRVISIEA